MSVEIARVREGHVEMPPSTLWLVSGVYLTFLEAPPLESTRKFISQGIARAIRISWRWIAIALSVGVT